jgi:NADH-quinone oxidoreductase subunit H
MKFGWKVLIPFSLVWIMVVSTLRIMSQQNAPRSLILAFIFAIALLYISGTMLFDRQKIKKVEASKITNNTEPSFPVPVIPNTRAEQING